MKNTIKSIMTRLIYMKIHSHDDCHAYPIYVTMIVRHFLLSFWKQCVSTDWASGHMLMAKVWLCNCIEEWHHRQLRVAQSKVRSYMAGSPYGSAWIVPPLSRSFLKQVASSLGTFSMGRPVNNNSWRLLSVDIQFLQTLQVWECQSKNVSA